MLTVAGAWLVGAVVPAHALALGARLDQTLSGPLAVTVRFYVAASGPARRHGPGRVARRRRLGLRPVHSSPDPDGEHRDGTAVDTLHREADLVLAAATGDDVEEREIVVGRGHREERVRPQALIVDERRVIVCDEQPTRLRLEPHGPIERLC